MIFSNGEEVRLTWLGELVATQGPSTDPAYSHMPHPPFIFKDLFDSGIVKSPAAIIGGPWNHGNPVNTALGVATVLIRATTEPGVISVKAYSNGLSSDDITLESRPSKASLLYDDEYLEASLKPENKFRIKVQQKGNNLPADVLELQKEIKQLRLDLLGRDQEIMELRSRLNE